MQQLPKRASKIRKSWDAVLTRTGRTLVRRKFKKNFKVNWDTKPRRGVQQTYSNVKM